MTKEQETMQRAITKNHCKDQRSSMTKKIKDQ
jgi:hypothetical protein